MDDLEWIAFMVEKEREASLMVHKNKAEQRKYLNKEALVFLHFIIVGERWESLMKQVHSNRPWVHLLKVEELNYLHFSYDDSTSSSSCSGPSDLLDHRRKKNKGVGIPDSHGGPNEALIPDMIHSRRWWYSVASNHKNDEIIYKIDDWYEVLMNLIYNIEDRKSELVRCLKCDRMCLLHYMENTSCCSVCNTSILPLLHPHSNPFISLSDDFLTLRLTME
jgi:hypothetical protein